MSKVAEKFGRLWVLVEITPVSSKITRPNDVQFQTFSRR